MPVQTTHNTSAGWYCSNCGNLVPWDVPHHCAPKSTLEPATPPMVVPLTLPIGNVFVDYNRIEEIVERVVRKVLAEKELVDKWTGKE